MPSIEHWTGKACFEGSVLGDLGGHDIFMVQTKNGKELYGEWISVFESNRSDFKIEIVSYGFSKDQFGLLNIENLATRTTVENNEILIIKNLIVTLFLNEEARKGILPFTLMSRGAKFLGNVDFRRRWVLTVK
jgi:hypothetical protein